MARVTVAPVVSRTGTIELGPVNVSNAEDREIRVFFPFTGFTNSSRVVEYWVEDSRDGGVTWETLIHQRVVGRNPWVNRWGDPVTEFGEVSLLPAAPNHTLRGRIVITGTVSFGLQVEVI